jgi:hypothetical protein
MEHRKDADSFSSSSRKSAMKFIVRTFFVGEVENQLKRQSDSAPAN